MRDVDEECSAREYEYAFEAKMRIVEMGAQKRERFYGW
jgi:hypothetical protein